MPHINEEEEEMSEMSSPEDEQLLPTSRAQRQAVEGRRARTRRLTTAAALGVAGLFGCLAVATLRLPSLSASGHGAEPRLRQGPLTVRSLLESPELTDLAANNLLALAPAAGADSPSPAALGRDALREQVARRFQNISATIKEKLPEVHEELSLIELSGSQKNATLRVLRKYSDPRMIDLTREVAAAARGDSEGFDRRLGERLGPKTEALRQLSEEMFPNGVVTLDIREELPGWHPTLEIDLADPAAPTGRRLADDAEGWIESGVRSQTSTLLKSLHAELGDRFPQAHARKLYSMFDDPPRSSNSASNADQSFMSCITKAVPHPMNVAKCIAENFGTVMSKVMGFMKGRAR